VAGIQSRNLAPHGELIVATAGVVPYWCSVGVPVPNGSWV
jgi:hypothetical protein